MISETYELRLRPNSSWIRIDWTGIWEYRDLLFILVRRDFVSRYKQTILGPAWFVIQPLLTTVVFTLIFGKVAGISTDGVPSTLFYLCGLLGWTYFANNFTGTSTTLLQNAHLFGKVYFPRLVVPAATILSNLFTFGIQLATFFVFWAWYKWGTASGGMIHIRWEVVLFPLVVLHIAILSLGVGLWMSSLTAKYRDFAQLSAFMVQLWMYATPVIYPLSLIPEKWRWLVVMNPMTMPVESLKYMLLGQGSVEPSYLFISIVFSVSLLATGLLIFQRVERTYIDAV